MEQTITFQATNAWQRWRARRAASKELRRTLRACDDVNVREHHGTFYLTIRGLRVAPIDCFKDFPEALKTIRESYVEQLKQREKL